MSGSLPQTSGACSSTAAPETRLGCQQGARIGVGSHGRIGTTWRDLRRSVLGTSRSGNRHSGNHGAVTDPLKHVDVIAQLAKEHGFTVGAAESLTGGAVSSALARGSQAAMWFHGGIVS